MSTSPSNFNWRELFWAAWADGKATETVWGPDEVFTFIFAVVLLLYPTVAVMSAINSLLGYIYNKKGVN